MSEPFADRIAVLGIPDSLQRYHAHVSAPWTPAALRRLRELGFNGVQINLAWGATFYDNGVSTIGSPYYRTAVGAHENSESPYDTFDQGGNVWEWNEAIPQAWDRGLRGGSFYYSDVYSLHASGRISRSPTDAFLAFGFRVSEVPEPGTMALLALGAVGMLRRRTNVRG